MYTYCPIYIFLHLCHQLSYSSCVNPGNLLYHWPTRLHLPGCIPGLQSLPPYHCIYLDGSCFSIQDHQVRNKFQFKD